MAIKTIDDSNLVAIADAIRAKNGSTDTYKPSEMAAAIAAIATSGGGGDWQTAAISTTYDSTTGITTVPVSNYISDIENGSFVLLVSYYNRSDSNYYSRIVMPALSKLYNAFRNNINGTFSPATAAQGIKGPEALWTVNQSGWGNANTSTTSYLSSYISTNIGTASFNENGDFIITDTNGVSAGKKLGYWAFLAYKEGA